MQQTVTSKCSFSKIVDGSFENVVQRTRDILKDNGFGIITEIDVKQTMKEKLNLEYPKFVILGACNPQLAHQALEADPAIGLFMPCNVMVRQLAGKVEVSAVDPDTMVTAVGNDKLTPVTNKAQEGLKQTIASL